MGGATFFSPALNRTPHQPATVCCSCQRWRIRRTMRTMHRAAFATLVVTSLMCSNLATGQDRLAANLTPYRVWQHSASIFILTTPAGANLPAAAKVERFPLLVRLQSDWFNFAQ